MGISGIDYISMYKVADTLGIEIDEDFLMKFKYLEKKLVEESIKSDD